MEFMATLHPEIQRGGLIGISQSRASGTSIAVARPGMPQEVPFDQGAESAFGCVIIGCFQFKDPTKNGGLCNPQGGRERGNGPQWALMWLLWFEHCHFDMRNPEMIPPDSTDSFFSRVEPTNQHDKQQQQQQQFCFSNCNSWGLEHKHQHKIMSSNIFTSSHPQSPFETFLSGC